MQVKGLGVRGVNRLLEIYQLPSAIIHAVPNDLAQHQFVNKQLIRALHNLKPDRSIIAQELDFCQKHNIEIIPRYSEAYPRRLLAVEDAPSMLFFKGAVPLNFDKTVAVIGTRSNTDYGKRATKEIIEVLQQQHVGIISGLAAGIDGIAHKHALDCGLQTVGVLGHGLDTIYPAHHRVLAQEMVKQGGLITEFPSGTVAHKTNFPMRNRIVAGLSDFILVVETREKGGAIITAQMGFNYNREVGALPGNIYDTCSKGCNMLIKSNVAHLVESGEDILKIMNWSGKENLKVNMQQEIFYEFSPEERLLVEVLKKERQLHFDELLIKTQLPYAQLSSILLHLEIQDIVASLPGKRYQLCVAI